VSFSLSTRSRDSAITSWCARNFGQAGGTELWNRESSERGDLCPFGKHARVGSQPGCQNVCGWFSGKNSQTRPMPSRPEEFHHRPLTEPCVRVSPYTARRGFENASLRKRPLSGGKTVRPGCPVDHKPHPATSSALLHPHYRGFTATIG
jgi:hypothetical protein